MIEGTFYGFSAPLTQLTPRIGTTVLSSQSQGGAGSSYYSSSSNSNYGGLGGSSFAQQTVGGGGGYNSAASNFMSTGGPTGIYASQSTTNIPSPVAYSRTTVLQSDTPGYATGYTSYSQPGYSAIQPIAAISPYSSINQTNLQALGGGYGLNAGLNSAFATGNAISAGISSTLGGITGIGNNFRTTLQTVPTPIVTNLNAVGGGSTYGSAYQSNGGYYSNSASSYRGGSLVGGLVNGK